LFLNVLAFALLVPGAMLVLYDVALAVHAMRRRTPPSARETPSDLRFALVMPAHNEGDGIEEALRACSALDFPKSQFELVVVADNCTDDTVDVLRAHGVRYLERHDTERRGKGYALRFAFDELMSEDFDAFVVLDADCWLAPHALRRFACELDHGARVLQANYVVSNADASPISYALAVGNAIENDLYYAPKSDLGWVVALRGTGMVFRREVLQEHPWGAYSIVEDLDYTMALYRAGVPVMYVADVDVYSPFPESIEQLRVQRERWAGGNVQMTKTSAVKLLLEGASRGRWIIADMGLTILSQSRPILLVLLWAGLLVSLVAFRTRPGAISIVALTLAVASNAALVAYLVGGIARLGLSAHRMSLLLRAPMALGQLVWISVRSVFGAGAVSWERTPRS
jgi:1,2-diacylglycerol 3-beta-glucosyltransferase